MFPPSRLPPPLTPLVVTEHWVKLPVSHSKSGPDKVGMSWGDMACPPHSYYGPPAVCVLPYLAFPVQQPTI